MTPTHSQPIPARLVLEDGSCFSGQSIGVPGTTLGELVFNTSTTGYQEVLTDPSYAGQVVLMTYPEIGNYGVNLEDYESQQIHAKGLVVTRLSPFTSSWRSQIGLQEFLQKNRVVGIQGVDTRAITRRLRQQGTMKAGITTDEIPLAEFVERIKAQPGLGEQDLVHDVSTSAPHILRNQGGLDPHVRLKRLVVVDYGIKKSILTYLSRYVEEVVVLPSRSTYAQIQEYQPQGVLLSNGPGDPEVLHDAVAMAKQLIESGIPTFGICLGHQILGLASGARMKKMSFGHHGGNHPVKDLRTGKIFITSQNHGYAAEFDGFPEDVLAITHINLNDGSIEGFEHRHATVMSVQFHPEASPGPHDANRIFAEFMQRILDHQPCSAA